MKNAISKNPDNSSKREKIGYVPLHILSDYSNCCSIGESIAKISSIVEKATRQNMPALALTDFNLDGALQFYTLCLAKNIKPILGQKIKLGSDCAIVLCKDLEAYKILCRHSAELYNHSDENLPFSKEECSHFVCISSNSDFTFAENFGEDFYVEIPANKSKEGAEKILLKCDGKKSVITNEVNFIEKGDESALDIFRKELAEKSETEQKTEKANPENYFKSEKEIKRFADELNHADVLLNTMKIAGKIPYIFPENYFEKDERIKRIKESLPAAKNSRKF